MLLRLGVDLGQSADNTALSAVELIQMNFEIRQIGRLPLGTPYPKIADTIVKAALQLSKIAAERDVELAKTLGLPVNQIVQPSKYNVAVYVDATGVGAPIIDMLAEPLRELENVILVPVELTSGDEKKEVIKVSGWRTTRVGKAYIVSRLKALLQSGRVVGAPSPEFEALQQELRDFRIEAKGTRDTYNAKSGSHDDLLISLALAVLDEIPGETEQISRINEELRVEHDIDYELNQTPGQTLFGWKWG